MANGIVQFDFEGKNVRFVGTYDQPEWVASDVCAVLEILKHRDALSRLDEDERGSVVVDTPGGRQEVGTVNESGLYALIFRSRKPAAKRFKKWVTSEVLPSIRRTGKYEISDLDRLNEENALLREKRKNLQSGIPADAVTLGTVAKMHGLKVEQLMFVLAENNATDLIKTFARLGEYHRIMRENLEKIDRMVDQYKLLNAGVQLGLDLE